MNVRLSGTLKKLSAVVLVIAAFAIPQTAWPQVTTEDPQSATPSPQQMTGAELFAKLLQANKGRDLRLQQYSETRSYVVRNANGKLHAEMAVRMDYRAPNTKSFATLCERGSHVVRKLVFMRLIDSEIDAASGRSHRDSSITPMNYTFQILGTEDNGGRRYFVVQATPRRKDKYLFAGRIWIDEEDFAIGKIAGHPARNPSFWIQRVDFVRQYQKIGDFWVPLKDESVTHLKIFGTKILTINHFAYNINQHETSAEPANPNLLGMSGDTTCTSNEVRLRKVLP